MSTYAICFCGEIWKIIPKLSPRFLQFFSLPEIVIPTQVMEHQIDYKQKYKVLKKKLKFLVYVSTFKVLSVLRHTNLNKWCRSGSDCFRLIRENLIFTYICEFDRSQIQCSHEA